MATTGPALWPSATTWPDTVVYPGQGTVPFIRCRISFDAFAAATRSWTDYSDRLRLWQVSRGRPNELQTFDAGTSTIVLANRDRQLDPVINNSIRPMNKIWLYEEFSGEVRDLFVGYAQQYIQSWPDGGWSNALTTIVASDDFRILNSAEVASGTVFPTNDNTGNRINTILDLIGSRVPRRVDPGLGASTFMATRTLSAVGRAIDEIQLAAATERKLGGPAPAFYVSASGQFVFRQAGWSSGDPTVAVFDDDGTDLPYLDATVDYSESFVFNTARVTAASTGVVGTSTDATSITDYGPRTYPSTTADPVTPGDVSTLAGILSGAYALPITRFVTLIPDLADAETLRLAASFDLLTKIQVFRTPPGGGARINQTLQIQNIQWTGANDGDLPRVTLGVSPL